MPTATTRDVLRVVRHALEVGDRDLAEALLRALGRDAAPRGSPEARATVERLAEWLWLDAPD